MSQDEPGAGSGAALTAGPAPDPWTQLRRHTAARIALGRSGASLPTREVLAFGLAHAQARDAVHLPLDVPALVSRLEQQGWPCLSVRSRAADRAQYLARPDWGRRVLDADLSLLDAAQGDHDLAIVVSDGLSSTGIQRHAADFLGLLQPQLAGMRLAPMVIATQARVALADEVAVHLGARMVVSLIGERPGLSSPDSMGLYLTWQPRIGSTDEARNCISNVRPDGLPLAQAALLLASLIRASIRARVSGVALRFDPSRALQGD